MRPPARVDPAATSADGHRRTPCGPGLGATPELDSVVLFGSGLAGLAGYALLRLRARRRRV